MLRTLFFALTAFVLVQACTDNTDPGTERKNGYTPVLKDRGDSLYHEVMKGHDTGMAKTGQINRAKETLKNAVDSLSKTKKADPRFLATVKSIQEDVEQADYSMQTWMTEFRADTLQDDKDKRASYLEKEVVKVNKVKDRILQSLLRYDSLYRK